MDEENMLPLKRVELSLTKFNEVAIPHHLDLLRQHKANIIKYEECGDVKRALVEQSHARRAVSQLRALLQELCALRARVRPADRTEYDARTTSARDNTLRAIREYLRASPLSIVGRSETEHKSVSASVTSTDSVGLVSHVEPEAVPLDDIGPLQLHVDEQELALLSRESSLRAWCELHAEVRALHEVWLSAHEAAHAQSALVHEGAKRVEVAAVNVSEAQGYLARVGGGAVWAGGACVGALVGGPVGLCAGAKAGALAAAAGSLLGYVAARLYRRRDTDTHTNSDKEQ